MLTAAYAERREALTDYFDRTALEAWAKLTSDAPVSRIRATVRAGRDRMRATLLSWLPADATGLRLLDAGCGTGALAAEAAARGADVVAVDVSPQLIRLARDRTGRPTRGALDFRAGDMTDPALGHFDHVIVMDSLIHYRAPDLAAALAALAQRTRRSIVFTFAPATPALRLMHTVGGLFPRADRAPAIEPVSPRGLAKVIARTPGLEAFRIGRTLRVSGGFYTSQALELVRG